MGTPLLVPDLGAAGLDELQMSLYPECGAGVFPCWYRAGAGDTYPSIAARFYGDESAWQAITQANWVYNPALDNPLTFPKISPGLVLVLPAQ